MIDVVSGELHWVQRRVEYMRMNPKTHESRKRRGNIAPVDQPS